jgi:hypothetical protein
MPRRCLATIAVLLMATPGLLRAEGSSEPDPLHLAGARVRLSAPELGAGKQVGTVVEVHADTLLFAADRRSTRVLVPTASLTGLDVSMGVRSHVGKGAGLGFLAGAVAGGVAGYVSLHDPHSSDGDWGPVGAAVGAALGGVVGLGIGALVGSRSTERWNSQRLPIQVGLLPGGSAFGLSFEISLMPREPRKRS